MARLLLDFSVPLRAFDLELTLPVERTVALVGPSGAGKTSVLRVVAGLLQTARGGVSLDGASWSGLLPEERRVGFVFQDYALFPHMSVRANVAYAGPVGDLLERFPAERVQVTVHKPQAPIGHPFGDVRVTVTRP